MHIYLFLIKYAESMQKVCSAKALLCLTLSTYSVLQQLSLFQTKPKPLNPNFKGTFFSPDIFGLIFSFFLSCVFSTIRNFSRINNLTIQARTTILQNKYSYLNAVKRSINTSSTPLIILINDSRLREYVLRKMFYLLLVYFR